MPSSELRVHREDEFKEWWYGWLGSRLWPILRRVKVTIKYIVSLLLLEKVVFKNNN